MNNIRHALKSKLENENGETICFTCAYDINIQAIFEGDILEVPGSEFNFVVARSELRWILRSIKKRDESGIITLHFIDRENYYNFMKTTKIIDNKYL